MTFRDATESDIPGIASLHAESMRSVYRGVLSDSYLDNQVHLDRSKLWRERFSEAAKNSMFVILAEINGRMAGFGCVFREQDPVFGSFLDNLHVAPELTGQGIGRELLSEIARRLLAGGSRAGVYLWVLGQNPRARKFYERAGASVVDSTEYTMPDGQRLVVWRCYWPDPSRLLL